MAEFIASAIALAIVFFIAPALGLLLGAFSAWAAGIFFPETLDLVSTFILGEAIPHWQLGAGLGFVGSFFKTTVTSS